MPRVKPLIREDPRAVETRQKIGALKGKLKITDSEISRRTGISKTTLSSLIGTKGDIGNMRLRQLWAILDLDKGEI